MDKVVSSPIAREELSRMGLRHDGACNDSCYDPDRVVRAQEARDIFCVPLLLPLLVLGCRLLPAAHSAHGFQRPPCGVPQLSEGLQVVVAGWDASGDVVLVVDGRENPRVAAGFVKSGKDSFRDRPFLTIFIQIYLLEACIFCRKSVPPSFFFSL
jgi:hypothetical protein